MNENYLLFKVNNFKKLYNYINEIDYKEINKWIKKSLFLSFKKKDFECFKYNKMQIQTINAKNYFVNKDSHNYLFNNLEIPTYSAIIFLEDSIFKIETKKNNYNSVKELNLKKGNCIIFKSDVGYYFFGKTKILHLYDIFPNEEIYNNYFPLLLQININKHNYLETIFEKLGQCYFQNLHYRYIWIHFIHYLSTIKDFQHKINLTDINPKKKQNKIISYEKNKIISIDKIVKEENVIVVIEPTNIESNDNYYLYLFIKSMIILTVIFVLFIFLKDKEINHFFTNPYSIENVTPENIVDNKSILSNLPNSLMFKFGDEIAIMSFPDNLFNIDTKIHM